MVLERDPDMMSLTDDEQDVASRLPTPQKAPRAPVDENLSPTALEAIKARNRAARAAAFRTTTSKSGVPY